MTLSSKDKTPNISGYGQRFHHTVPQRHVSTVVGSFLVPASADDLPPVPLEHVETIERALNLLADLLSDKDHQLFMASYPDKRANEEAAVIRRLTNGALRSMLGPDARDDKTRRERSMETRAKARRGLARILQLAYADVECSEPNDFPAEHREELAFGFAALNALIKAQEV